MAGREAAVSATIRLFLASGPVAGLDDGELLERFATRKDEAAFAALVALHGPMMLGVCRRFLRDGRDIEDALQATFLVLVRRAGSLRGPGGLGLWLHGVARRVAPRARAEAARRRSHEGRSEPCLDRAGRGDWRRTSGAAPSRRPPIRGASRPSPSHRPGSQLEGERRGWETLNQHPRKGEVP